MEDPLTLIIIAIVGAFFMFALMKGLMEGSGWTQFKEKYRYTDELPVKMKGCQNGLLNQTCFNGTLSLGVSNSGLFIGMGAIIFIPFSDLKLTDERRYIRYRILKIKDTNLQVGLEKRWIKEIENNSQQIK